MDQQPPADVAHIVYDYYFFMGIIGLNSSYASNRTSCLPALKKLSLAIVGNFRLIGDHSKASPLPALVTVDKAVQ